MQSTGYCNLSLDRNRGDKKNRRREAGRLLGGGAACRSDKHGAERPQDRSWSVFIPLQRRFLRVFS